MIFLAAIAILQGIVTLIDGIRAARYMRAYRVRRVRRERIRVFCPCKGIDAEFEKNIRSILEQDYPNYEVTFIVESEHDAAHAALRNLGARNILVAGPARDCGQKVHNLAYAVTHEAAAADIYVFCDNCSDTTAEIARRYVPAANVVEGRQQMGKSRGLEYILNTAVYPHGLNAHEFAVMVKLGLTPLQSVQTATTSAADLLGWSDKVGTIEAGKWADIVAVDGDPLSDVTTLQNVKFVMKGGEVYKNEYAISGKQ